MLGRIEQAEPITLFMCGDVMTGRGIDQVLPHPSEPHIYERSMRSARGYVELAERAHGPIDAPVDFAYIWGDALAEFERVVPDVKLINLETSVTASEDYWKGKGINYRMNPKNIACLTAAGIDCCALANNHVLDWGYAGLVETLETLEQARVAYAGAGRNREEAEQPAVLDVAPRGRVLILSLGATTSGIPRRWAATDEKPGVHLLKGFTDEVVQEIKTRVHAMKRAGDIAVVSIHWGSNWGYEIPPAQIDFAHALVDAAGIDVVHGHSSHHVKAMEVYRQKLILYGCGDFITDYEGIRGYEEFRGELSLMYFAQLEPATGNLVALQMTPTQMRNFRVQRAPQAEAAWLHATLNREGEPFGTRVALDDDGRFTLHWA